MPEHRGNCIELKEGIELWSTPKGLVLKVVDYHAGPALLTWDQVAELLENRPLRLAKADPVGESRASSEK